MKKISLFMLCVLTLCFCFCCTPAYAVSGQKISIDYSAGDQKLSGAVFSLYYVGSVRGTHIIPQEDFTSYKVDFDISSAEKSASLARTLSAYIRKDGIEPLCTDICDKNSNVDFGGRVFKSGAYLIVADKHTQDNSVYICEPCIVVLSDDENETVIIKPKYEIIPGDKDVSYKVIKSWKDSDKAVRPDSITVELLCDGKVFDSVTLNEDNNWRYQWNGLSALRHWTVVEASVPDRYTVSLSRFGKTFLLTNTATQEETTTSPDETTTAPDETTTAPDETTTAPDETTTAPDDTTSPGNTTTTKPTTTDTPQDEPELPVTGMLRWPVPYLAMTGVLLFIMGYAKYRKSESEDE